MGDLMNDMKVLDVEFSNSLWKRKIIDSITVAIDNRPVTLSAEEYLQSDKEIYQASKADFELLANLPGHICAGSFPTGETSWLNRYPKFDFGEVFYNSILTHSSILDYRLRTFNGINKTTWIDCKQDIELYRNVLTLNKNHYLDFLNGVIANPKILFSKETLIEIDYFDEPIKGLLDAYLFLDYHFNNQHLHKSNLNTRIAYIRNVFGLNVADGTVKGRNTNFSNSKNNDFRLLVKRAFPILLRYPFHFPQAYTEAPPSVSDSLEDADLNSVKHFTFLEQLSKNFKRKCKELNISY